MYGRLRSRKYGITSLRARRTSCAPEVPTGVFARGRRSDRPAVRRVESSDRRPPHTSGPRRPPPSFHHSPRSACPRSSCPDGRDETEGDAMETIVGVQQQHVPARIAPVDDRRAEADRRARDRVARDELDVGDRNRTDAVVRDRDPEARQADALLRSTPPLRPSSPRPRPCRVRRSWTADRARRRACHCRPDHRPPGRKSRRRGHRPGRRGPARTRSRKDRRLRTGRRAAAWRTCT